MTSTFPCAEGDGRGPFVADLAAAEQACGIDVRVLAPHAAGLAPVGVVGGVAVRRFRYGPAAAERLAYGAGLMAASRSVGGAPMVPLFLGGMAGATVVDVRRWRPDLVHAHWWLPGGVAGAVAGVVTGCPFVVTLHGSDVAIAAHHGVRHAARWVARRARAVVAVSAALAAEASPILGVPVLVAPMPVVVPPIAAHRPSGGPLRLVAVGRLAPEKGFDVLLDALHRLDAEFRLDVLGDGPLRAELQGRAAGPAVRFHGLVPRTEYHALVAGSDAVVVPSRREGLGLVAVEAVLLGVPVIASAVGGLPAALGSHAGTIGAVPGGFLVPPGDAPALAAALASARTLPAPGGEALVAAARHRPDVVAARHLEVYRSALS